MTTQTQELELAPADAPDINTLARIDTPAFIAELKAKLAPLKAVAESLTVTDVSQTAEMATARSTRLQLKDLRVSVVHRHKELKENILSEGRKIDSFKNELIGAIEPLEARLALQEKFIEIEDAKRVESLKADRSAELVAIGANPALYNVGTMNEAEWGACLTGLKLAAEKKLADDKAAEEARLAKEKADAEERARIAAENERLRAEAAEKEAALKAERAAAEAERQAAAAAAKAEAERVEKERAVERAKAAKEQAAKDAKAKAEADALAAKLKTEREAREKIEAEQRAREEAEATRAKAEADERAAAAKAPDREKLLAIAAKLRDVTLPGLATEAAKTLLSDFITALEKKAKAL